VGSQTAPDSRGTAVPLKARSRAGRAQANRCDTAHRLPQDSRRPSRLRQPREHQPPRATAAASAPRHAESAARPSARPNWSTRSTRSESTEARTRKPAPAVKAEARQEPGLTPSGSHVETSVPTSPKRVGYTLIRDCPRPTAMSSRRLDLRQSNTHHSGTCERRLGSAPRARRGCPGASINRQRRPRRGGTYRSGSSPSCSRLGEPRQVRRRRSHR
jgi:hypothetical protein